MFAVVFFRSLEEDVSADQFFHGAEGFHFLVFQTSGRVGMEAQGLGAEAVISQVGRKAHFFVGLHCVGSGVLEMIGLEFVNNSYSPAFLSEVEDDAFSFSTLKTDSHITNMRTPVSILASNSNPYYRDEVGEYRADGYYNPVTGYGGSDDNIENTRFAPSAPLDQVELSSQYESNWVVARGIEAPVNDRLAKGVTFITNDDDSEGRRKEIEAVENDLRDIDAFDQLIQASYWERLFGGSLIYFDFGDDGDFGEGLTAQGSRISQSINFELRDSQRGIPNKIWVVDRWMAFPMSYYTAAIHGPDHPKLGEPEIYSLTLHTTGYSRLVFAHETRCIILKGLSLPARQRAANQMWGNSLLQRVNDAVKYFGISLKAMADTFEDFNYKSLEIEGLTELIEKEAWEVIGKMISMAAKNANNQNVGVHGKETKLKKQQTTVTGLPDMAKIMTNVVCGAWNIPYSRFFSAEGGALAGTAAETDVKNYHESLRFDQERKDRPRIERFIWLLGYESADFPFVFPALKDLTLKERVEAEKAKVEMYNIAIGAGMIHPEEAAVSMWSTPESNLEQTIINFEDRESMEPDEKAEDEEEKPEGREQENRADAADYEVSPVFKVKIREPELKTVSTKIRNG